MKLIIDEPPLSVNRAYGVTSNRGKAFMYQTNEMDRYKDTVSWIVKAGGIKQPMEGPLELRVVFYFKAQHRENKKLRGYPYPDTDGPTKPLLDALEGVLYEDDSQIIRECFEKKLDTEDPRTEVEVTVYEGV